MKTETDSATALFMGKCRRCKAPHRFEFERFGPRAEAVARDANGDLRNVHEWAWNAPLSGVADNRPTCKECGYQGPWRLSRIAGTHNPEVACNARCMGATGPSCDCSCGGRNHGARYAA